MRTRYLVIVLICLLPTLALANGMEVLTLQNRSANEVLPALRPLLEPGGVLTGVNDQIILRASSANRVQIKAALAAIDKPARQLLIYVSQNRQQNGQQHELTGSVHIGPDNRPQRHQSESSSNSGITARLHNGNNNANIQMDDTQRSSDQHASQMLRVVDGGSAYIKVGVSVPILMHQVYFSPSGPIISDSSVYRNIGSGFYATPHLSGQRVTLEISPQLENSSDNGNGAINLQRIYTTIATRLGEWTQIGGTDTQDNHQNKDLLGSTSSNSAAHGGVWIKVDEVPQ